MIYKYFLSRQEDAPDNKPFASFFPEEYNRYVHNAFREKFRALTYSHIHTHIHASGRIHTYTSRLVHCSIVFPLHSRNISRAEDSIKDRDKKSILDKPATNTPLPCITQLFACDNGKHGHIFCHSSNSNIPGIE